MTSRCLAVPLATIALLASSARADDPPASSLVGTWRLESRVNADGTKVEPAPVGLLTYTETHRNFNVMWQDASGKHFSFSLVSTWELTATEYVETIHLGILNDELRGTGLTYLTPGETRRAPARIEGAKVSWAMPFDPVAATCDGEAFVATSAEFGFTDHWVRVDEEDEAGEDD